MNNDNETKNTEMVKTDEKVLHKAWVDGFVSVETDDCDTAVANICFNDFGSVFGLSPTQISVLCECAEKYLELIGENSTPQKTGKWLSLTDAAFAMRSSERTVRRCVKSGVLPTKMVNGHRFVLVDNAENLVEATK
jgi:hypothetical protein